MLPEDLAPTPPDRSSTLAAPGAGARRRGSSTEQRFVGRHDELARLRSAIDMARRGTSSVVLVSGEPGIGKTRLCLEASIEAHEMHVVWGRCWEAGGAPPYWPWIEVLRQLLVAHERPSGEAPGRHASQLARLVPEAFPDAEPAAAPADPESGRFLLFDAFALLLRRSAARRPLLVVLDDIHAADQASILLLVFLARALTDCGIALIATCRDTEVRSRADLIDGLGELARSASRIALQGLSSTQVRAMLERDDGTQPSDALVERIHRATDGNPFFVREIGRLLPEHATASPAVAFRVPDGITDTVRRRLQPLPDGTRSLLTIAAVTGREFDGIVVSRAAAVDLITLLERLEPAISHGIVDVIPGEVGRFSFRHALIQETIYGDLSPGVRIRMHRDVRDALEEISQTAPDRYVALLAQHALAAAPAGDDERFVKHGIRAARAALQRMAFEEGVELYQRTIDALVHARPDERRRFELLLALGEAREWSNDARGSRSAIENAAAIARRLGAPDLLARAALAVGQIEALKATASSRCETAGHLLREALAVVDQRDKAILARLRSHLGLHYLTSGDLKNALLESAAAVRDARACDEKDVLARALISRHAVLYGPDHLDERCAIEHELSELASALNDREFAMRAQALRVVNALEVGDLATVDDATALHCRLADATQDPFERWANLMWRCARALLVGRFDEASKLAHEGLHLTRTVSGPHAFEINGPAAYLGQLLLIEDTRFGALPDATLIEQPRAQFQEVVAWQAANLLHLTRNRLLREVRTEVDALLGRGVVDADRCGTWLVAMSALAEAIALLGDHERAAELYPKLLPYAQRNITVSFVACRGSVSRFLGLLAGTMGSRDTASRHFDDALGMNRRMGARPHVAATLYDHATMLLRMAPRPDEQKRAIAMCHEALKIAQELEMPGLQDCCRELLATHDVTPQPEGSARPPDDFELVARGSFWSVSHAGREIVVKDRKGLRYIAELLRNPDRDVHARDLVALFRSASDGDPIVPAGSRVLHQAEMHTGDFSEQLVDPRARRAYERRLAQLDDELQMAGSTRDPEQLAVLREERNALRREMARITGLGGRPRRIADTERMRLAVTRAIRSALAEIADASPEFGGKLAQRIRTGTCCRYSSASASERPRPHSDSRR